MKPGLREIIFIVLLMAIPIGAWWFVFKPSNARNAEIRQQIEIKQAKLRLLNQATASIGDLKKEIKSLEDAIDFFQSKLPSEKEIDKVLKEVWQLAESNNLTTKNIRTLKRKRDKNYSTATSRFAEQPISMKLEGDFQGFYAFLLALEQQPRIMRVSKMDVSKVEDGPQGQIQADFIMSIFFENKG